MISGDDAADELQKNREILFEPKQEETSLDDSKMGNFDIYFNCAIKLHAPTYLLLDFMCGLFNGCRRVFLYEYQTSSSKFPEGGRRHFHQDVWSSTSIRNFTIHFTYQIITFHEA